MTIEHAVPARVGLLGNPSDGYGGRTMALAVPAFQAAVSLAPADRLEIVANEADEPVWASVGDLVDRVDRHGYGTGPRLLAAVVRTYADVLDSIDERGFGRSAFRLTYRTDIPRQVGLGGSSALVIATLRCLIDFTGVELPAPVLPSIALRVETEQLGIVAGLQDRVVQSYGGLVAMNFAEMTVDARFGVSHGEYRTVERAALPPLFLAYREQAAEPSTAYHRRLRSRFEAGDNRVRDALRSLAALVVEGEALLRWRDTAGFADLLAQNMTLRRQLGRIPSAQLELVEAADECEAPATFAGSGGAVVGAFIDDEHYDQIEARMALCDAITVRLDVADEARSPLAVL